MSSAVPVASSSSVMSAPDDPDPDPVTLSPTLEELEDIPAFISNQEQKLGLHRHGICKIRLPAQWRPRRNPTESLAGDAVFHFPHKQAMGNADHGGGARLLSLEPVPAISAEDFAELAQEQERRARRPPRVSHQEAERIFWNEAHNVMAFHSGEVKAKLADPDVKAANLSRLGDGILAIIRSENPAWMESNVAARVRLGCWLAARPWRSEPADLYLACILHSGSEPTTWYCVPPGQGRRLERLVRRLFPREGKSCANFVSQETCLVPPKFLRRHEITVRFVVISFDFPFL